MINKEYSEEVIVVVNIHIMFLYHVNKRYRFCMTESIKRLFTLQWAQYIFADTGQGFIQSLFCKLRIFQTKLSTEKFHAECIQIYLWLGMCSNIISSLLLVSTSLMSVSDAHIIILYSKWVPRFGNRTKSYLKWQKFTLHSSTVVFDYNERDL